MTTLDLPAILLAASRAVPSSRPSPSVAAVDGLLATLPARAAVAQFDGAAYFDFTRHCPADVASRALDAAACARLREVGLVVFPYDEGILISYEALRAAAAGLEPVPPDAEAARYAAWLLDVQRRWQERAGIDATVEAAGDDLTFLAPSSPSAVGPYPAAFPLHVEGRAQPVAEVVALAAAALRLPAWTLEGLVEVWRARGGASVTREAGHWLAGRYRAVEVLCFSSAPPRADVVLDVEDVHSLSAVEVVERTLERSKTIESTNALPKSGTPPLPPEVNAALHDIAADVGEVLGDAAAVEVKGSEVTVTAASPAICRCPPDQILPSCPIAHALGLHGRGEANGHTLDSAERASGYYRAVDETEATRAVRVEQMAAADPRGQAILEPRANATSSPISPAMSAALVEWAAPPRSPPSVEVTRPPPSSVTSTRVEAGRAGRRRLGGHGTGGGGAMGGAEA